MASSRRARGRRSAIRRAWFYSLLLSAPALVLTGVFVFRRQIGTALAILLVLCLLLYLLLVTGALVEGLIRPLQTLSNVVSSLREGDYSFRARGAGAPDALGELAHEINTLADLLQKQRVRSFEATALLARILEVMQAPLFAFDRDDTLQLVNDAGLKLLGQPHARCFGRSARDLGLEDLLGAPDQTTHVLHFEPSSAPRSARWLLRRASFRQEGVPHTLLVLADVSQPLLEEEQIAWKRLIRVLGHELSNSLAPIISIAGSLSTRVQDLRGEDTTKRDFSRGLRIVESRAEALHRFVQSYRRLAQLPPPKFKSISLGPLIERVALLEQRIPVQIDPGPQLSLAADSDQLEQMLINLLANAVDASLLNGSKHVKASWKVDGAQVIISIEDHGMGIANSENLFVPFYTTKPTGSGVGLALAQQIARSHGGEVFLANRDDHAGARATVRLAIKPFDLAEDAREF